VDEISQAKMEEFAFIYPVLNEERSKEADMAFCKFAEGVFHRRIVSSVFLTGEAFEKDVDWFPHTKRVICNGRRAFMGNNLYSRGACYTAFRKLYVHIEDPVYITEDKLTDQVTINMRVGGQELWLPIITWGSRWYESNHQWEALMHDVEDLELHIESLVAGSRRVEYISMEGFPIRTEYSMRILIETLFLDPLTCKVSVRDLGFGEFFPPSDFYVEKVLQLGGNDGKFGSMS